jgi:hypothetical protein
MVCLPPSYVSDVIVPPSHEAGMLLVLVKHDPLELFFGEFVELVLFALVLFAGGTVGRGVPLQMGKFKLFA